MRNKLVLPLYGKASLAVAALAGFFAFATAVPIARADDCQERIAKIDHNLHEAIEHHGPQSSQANHWRHELHEQRERCYTTNHRWWDEDDHRWHTDRDWDDHDHDGDHH
jgi:hypothetical protein